MYNAMHMLLCYTCMLLLLSAKNNTVDMLIRNNYVRYISCSAIWKNISRRKMGCFSKLKCLGAIFMRTGK